MKYREFETFGAATVVLYLFELKGQKPDLYTVRFPWWLGSNIPELCSCALSHSVQQWHSKLIMLVQLLIIQATSYNVLIWLLPRGANTYIARESLVHLSADQLCKLLCWKSAYMFLDINKFSLGELRTLQLDVCSWELMGSGAGCLMPVRLDVLVA